MNILIRFSLGLFIAALSLNTLPVFAATPPGCRLNGSYAYLYKGTIFSLPSSLNPGAPLLTATAVLTETGVFTIDRSGQLTGEGTVALKISNFFGKGPLWVLVSEEQKKGVAIPDDNSCTGTISYESTYTVINSSNTALMPLGTTLSLNDPSNQPKPRTVAYTISGLWSENVEVISTDPDTLVSGEAHRTLKAVSR